MSPLFAFLNIGPMEWIIIGVIAILLFGKNLPNVARSLGKSMVEFKKGVGGLEDDLDVATKPSQAPSTSAPSDPISHNSRASPSGLGRPRNRSSSAPIASVTVA